MNQLVYNMTEETYLQIVRQKARNIRVNQHRKLLTNKQRIAIILIFKGFEREERLAALSKLLARKIWSTTLLSIDEASLIIEEAQTPEFADFLNSEDFW